MTINTKELCQGQNLTFLFHSIQKNMSRTKLDLPIPINSKELCQGQNMTFLLQISTQRLDSINTVFSTATPPLSVANANQNYQSRLAHNVTIPVINIAVLLAKMPRLNLLATKSNIISNEMSTHQPNNYNTLFNTSNAKSTV